MGVHSRAGVCRVLQVGYGRIGSAIADLLSADERFSLVVAEHDLSRRSLDKPFQLLQLDVTDSHLLEDTAREADVIVSAGPHYLSPLLATLARQMNCHYFDMTESLEAAAQVRSIAEGAPRCLVSHCGVAPGFLSVVAAHLLRQFPSIEVAQ